MEPGNESIETGIAPLPVVLPLAETIARIKKEILEDVRAGIVPASVKSFRDLHDYVDANCYGGFCDDEYIDALIKHFGGRDEHEGMPDGVLVYLNDAQNATSTWIMNDGIASEIAEDGVQTLRAHLRDAYSE